MLGMVVLDNDASVQRLFRRACLRGSRYYIISEGLNDVQILGAQQICIFAVDE